MKKLFVESIPLIEPRPSGVGHSLAGLTSALASKKFGYEMVLVAPKRGLGGLEKWPKLRNCARKALPVRTKILNGLIKFHILPAVDKLIGNGVYLFGNFKNWPLSSKSSSLTFIHDICYVLYPEFVSPPNQRYLEKNIPYFMKRTNVILTVSEQSKKEICAYYNLDKEKVAVVYNGVNPDFYKKISLKRAKEITSRYGIEGNYLIYVGNIEPRKNLLRFIQAFAKLRQSKTQEISLVLIGGNGWLNEEIILLIDKLKRQGVRIIKPVQYVSDEDLRILIASAYALVQPSIHEGFSMPPLEAMAAGTIVAASDIPVHREILSESVLYFDPFSEESMVKTLQHLLGLPLDKKEQFEHDAVRRSKLFSWDNSADQFISILKDIS